LAKSWRVGRVCRRDDLIETEKAAVVAEVYSRALRPDDGGFVAAYFLAHELETGEAEDAMNFFSAQASLLVDASRLVEDAGAEFPALVTIRYTDDVAGYMVTVNEHNILRMLPGDDVVSQEGWDIFCARRALLNGEQVDDAQDLGGFDYRALRRKVYANRASVQEDRQPWLIEEYKQLRALTQGSPEGSETMIALADDMEAALDGLVDVGDTFSVVIPTKVERSIQRGAIPDWLPQVGREVVVAHGLSAIQAARTLVVVEADPEAFVDKGALFSSLEVRETLCPAFIVPDHGLNWISTDFSGRRSKDGYERLQELLNAPRATETAGIYQLQGRSNQR
jgi:hypothetical protein